MKRDKCVICNELIDSNKIPCLNIFNTVNIVEIIDYKIDEIKTLQFIGCKNCGCIQLENLFPQSEIYAQPLQIFDGPVIQKHHDLFCDFVIKNINYDPNLFEIGGSYGKLANRIISKYNENSFDIRYKIMEFSSDQYPPINNIEYITGNCEDYDYKGTTTIIMSHVFEHLYNPREFIEKISKTDIQNIFISIPDMDGLMQIGDINNINILHTFYINTKFIVYLFQLYGFILKDKYDYTNNSIFYYFVKSSQKLELEYTPLKNSIRTRIDSSTKLPVTDLNKAPLWGADSNLHQYKQISLLKEIPTFYETVITKIKSINILNPFYICPSGFYGQFIYFYLNENSKKNVKGFLDGDPFKINKRLSGTPIHIYEKKYISSFENMTILITSAKHHTEIKNELLQYNSNITCINSFE